jgi:hypothetical protein
VSLKPHVPGVWLDKSEGYYPGATKPQHDHAKTLSGSPRISRFYLGLVKQDHVQQGIVDFDFSVVFDKAQFAEFVHEKAHT